jgi:hypothetical protein
MLSDLLPGLNRSSTMGAAATSASGCPARSTTTRGKDLKAAFRSIHVAQRFPNSGKPYRVYVGIDLV